MSQKSSLWVTFLFGNDSRFEVSDRLIVSVYLYITRPVGAEGKLPSIPTQTKCNWFGPVTRYFSALCLDSAKMTQWSTIDCIALEKFSTTIEKTLAH